MPPSGGGRRRRGFCCPVLPGAPCVMLRSSRVALGTGEAATAVPGWAATPTGRLQPIDEYVFDVVVARLSSPDAADLLMTSQDVDLGEIRREIAAVHVRRDAIAEAYADGVVSLSQFKAANAKLMTRLAELEAKLPVSPVPALAELATAPDPRQLWESLDDDARRQVIDALMIVRIAPARTKEQAYLDWRARVANPETVVIEWRTARC